MFVTKANNVYELLDEITDLVNEEPRRLDMGEWLVRGERILTVPPSRRPECGTIACIAGWAMTLTGHNEVIHLISERAESLFMGDSYDDELRRDIVLLFHTIPSAYEIGTMEYVNHVVKHIKSFQETWESHLRSTKIKAIG